MEIFTKEKQTQLTRKFMDSLAENGIGEEELGLIGAFYVALQCVLEPDLLDHIIAVLKKRQKRKS